MIKKLVIIVVALALILAPVSLACTEPAEEEEEEEPTGPQYGGVMRIIVTALPLMMAYPGLMSPGDHAYVFPAVERLIESGYDDGVRYFEPFLCESYFIDTAAKTFTFHLRDGIRFSDGSEFNAEVVKWNFEMNVEGGWVQDADKIESIETPDGPDGLTVVIHFTEYSNQIEFNWGWSVNMNSKAAWEAAGTTLEERIDWATDHVVGTGPFVLKEYQRDVKVVWEKNDDYWQEGRPYLDGLEYILIPDSVTASAMLQAGEVDMWAQGSAASDWEELEAKNFTVQNYWVGMPNMLMGNTVNPESKWQDKNLREALEYAIDKEAIAGALGLGYYKALDQIAPEGEWGYVPDLDVREYNPGIAKDLMAASGYSAENPCEVTLLVQNVPASVDAGEAIESYLDAAFFDCELDLADFGRYYGSFFGFGWDDLIVGFYGMDVNNLATYMSWFSHDPKTNIASFERTPEQIEMDKAIVLIADPVEQEAALEDILSYLHEEARFCPLWWVPSTWVAQPYVHTDYFQQGFIRWRLYDAWMGEH